MSVVTKPVQASVTAARAIANYTLNRAITAQSIADTSANIAGALDQLQLLAAAGDIASIMLLDPSPLSIGAASYAADAQVLGLLPAAETLILSGVSAAAARTVQADARVAAFAVADAAGNVAANLDALAVLTKLSAITLTNTIILTLTHAQFISAAAALAKLAAGFGLIVTGVSAAAAGALQADTRVRLFSVSGTAAAIAASLDGLTRDGKLTAITVTDPAPISISAAQFINDTAAIGKLSIGASLAIAGVPARNAAAMQANGKVAAFSVSDTAANVAANLATLAVTTKLRGITLTDAGALPITVSQMQAYAATLTKLASGLSLAVSGAAVTDAALLQSNALVRSFAISDGTARVAGYLDALNGDGKLTAIALTDSQTMSLTWAQWTRDIAILSKIVSPWSVAVTGAPAAAAGGLVTNANVSGFTVSDTAAAVAANLDALNGDMKLTAIGLTGTATLTLRAAQVIGDAVALGKLAPGYQIVATGVTVGNLSAILANPRVTSILIADTAANIAASLPALNNAFQIASIALTSGTKLALNYARYAAFGIALGKLAAPVLLAVSGVTAANAAAVQANPRVSSFGVIDTAGNVAAYLPALSNDGKLSTIAIVGPAALTMTYAQYLSAAAVLGKVVGTYSLTVNDAAAAANLAANPHVSQFTVSDTLVNIGASLDQLEIAAKSGKLTSISVADSGGTIDVSPARYAADADAIALIHGSFTIAQTPSSAGARINLIWDTKSLAAPAQFRSAVSYAAQYIQSLIVNPITVNIDVGYGEVVGSPLGKNVLGAAGPDQGIGRTWAQFKNDLSTHNTSAATQTILNNLPSTDPSNGGTIYLASAEARALGLMPASGSGVDGSMGFAADPNGTLFTYDPNNRAAQGKYDLIGIVEHEVTHALGRIALGGTYGDWISALDVFRFAAPGAHSPNAGTDAYFSIDNGMTNLDWFAPTSDLGDWAASAGNDANDAFSNAGVVNQYTPTDVLELNAMGFATSGTPSASSTFQTVVSAADGLNAKSLTFLGSPSLAFMTDDLPVLNVSLDPPGGIEEIAWFEYGVNQLRIDLSGAAPSALVAFDATVDGQHAIALANQADLTHGIILTKLPASDTAADLMANHLSFSGGMAIVA